MSRITSLLRRTFGVAKEHVGTDHLGNKYYYIPEQKSWTGRVIRPRRLVEAANPKEFEYMEGSIPSEWDGNSDYINEQIQYFYDNVNPTKISVQIVSVLTV
uniref:NADH:ubiquinone oxidoreductase complex assembly factor 2 n=2 Tax=Sinocyclocheilus TaxID=75365 RepID=A0A671MQK1_9TELE